MNDFEENPVFCDCPNVWITLLNVSQNFDKSSLRATM